MGHFFVSTQTYNSKQLDRIQFMKLFCKEMQNNGYVRCESNESELSYVLTFSEKSKWVTITSENHEQSHQALKKDASRIAKMLKTSCVHIEVIDSDCAIMNLYDEAGTKVDTLIMGRADNYFGNDIPQPSEKVWEPFLVNESTWDLLSEVRNTDYVFIEDGLRKIAPLIGMDSENMISSAESVVQEGKSELACFKKANEKTEKKLTLNIAFQQFFGEALEPFGFLKPKLRQPYYIRMVGDEILHIIGIYDMKSHLILFGGIATVYRETLCLDQTFRQNETWLKTAMYFYVQWHISDQPFDPEIQSGFHYHKLLDSQSLSVAVQHALHAAVTWILPVLDRVQTLKDVLDFTRNNGAVLSLPLQESHAAPYSDTAIQFLLKDPLNDLEQRYVAALKAQDEENTRFQRTPEAIAEGRARYEQMMDESRRRLHLFLEDTDIHHQTLEELARRKAHNIELLRKYGIS